MEVYALYHEWTRDYITHQFKPKYFSSLESALKLMQESIIRYEQDDNLDEYGETDERRTETSYCVWLKDESGACIETWNVEPIQILP